MLTLLLYVLIVGLVAGVLFLVAGAVFGRGEDLPPLPAGTTATALPATGIGGDDVRALRFQQVVRGYKASEVDWALARLAARIDELESELDIARGGGVSAVPPSAYSAQPGVAYPSAPTVGYPVTPGAPGPSVAGPHVGGPDTPSGSPGRSVAGPAAGL